MRMEVSTVRGVGIINDAYNANPASMEAAARTLHQMECAGRKLMVVADMLELGDETRLAHRRAGRTIGGFAFDYLLGVGEHTPELLDAAAERGMHQDDVVAARSKNELAETLVELLEPGDTVLFKGSRSNRLEEVIALVQAGLEGGAAPEQQQPAQVAGHEPGCKDETRTAAQRHRSAAAHTVG
jgi:UDP-N-acetylmuramyl pentapeptide synthase